MSNKTVAVVFAAGCIISLLTACGEPTLECSSRSAINDTGAAVIDFVKQTNPDEASRVERFMKVMLLTGQKSEICGLSATAIQDKSHNIVKDKVGAFKRDIKSGIDVGASRTKSLLDSLTE